MMVGWLTLWAAATAMGGEWEHGGDTKAFFVTTVPYEHDWMPDEPAGQGVVSGRVFLRGRLEGFSSEVQPAWSFQAPGRANGGMGGSGMFVQTSSGLPEVVDLSWELAEGEDLIADLRMERLWVGWSAPHVTARLGRQPVTLGVGSIFAPLDLVNPFHPTVMDQEVKPGVDSMRVDGFFGTSGRVVAVAAYVGDQPLLGADNDECVPFTQQEVVIASHLQQTFGMWDLGLFVGDVRQDWVVGLTAAGGVGPVAIRFEGTRTHPPEEAEEDPFVRAALASDWRPTLRTTLSGELYAQTHGAQSPDDYLDMYANERLMRGEMWAVGRYYGALMVLQEITPLTMGSLAFISNLEDGSAMLGPALSISMATNAHLDLASWFGLGERPGDPDMDALMVGADLASVFPVNSEFGLTPTTIVMSMKMYW